MQEEEFINDSWVGELPEACDLCKVPIHDCKYFYDAQSREAIGRVTDSDGQVSFTHVWAIMCPFCFLKSGAGLGWGMGQKFEVKTRKCVDGLNKNVKLNSEITVPTSAN